MIYTTKELLKLGETFYSIKNKLANHELFFVEKGIYSDEKDPIIDDVYFSKKYPHAIITGLSAFYIYDLTDYIPESVNICTVQHSFPIKDSRVVQSYQDPSFFEVGVTVKEIEGGNVRIYDMERLLIELIRLKERFPEEVYFDVLNSFRRIKEQIDFYKVNKYLKVFKNGKTLSTKIKEVI